MLYLSVSTNRVNSQRSETYIFQVGIVLGPAPVTTPPPTGSNDDGLGRLVHELKEKGVPDSHVEKGARPVVAFQVGELEGFLWSMTMQCE
jgi:hypothetical protein